MALALALQLKIEYKQASSDKNIMKVQSVAVVTLTSYVGTAVAFAPLWSNIFKARGVGIGNGSGSGNGNGSGNINPPPPPYNPAHWSSQNEDDDGNDWNGNDIFAASILGVLDDQDEESLEQDTFQDTLDDQYTLKMYASADDVVAGTKASLKTSQTYWSDAFESIQTKVSNTMSRINPFKKKKDEHEIDMYNIPIRAVVAESDILPEIVVRSAAQRAGLLGSVMRSDRVNECARHLKNWYVQRGYVLHSVTGATLHSDNGTATLTLQEPVLFSTPVDIKFAKEVPVDPETGETTTRRKLREKMERQKGRPLRREEWAAVASTLNTTLIEAKGRTNPHTLSKRMGLRPGRHFQWDGQKWRSIAQSGIFSKIYNANPAKMRDGSVQLQVLCEESPPRNLEYGLSKSLYTGHWVS